MANLSNDLLNLISPAGYTLDAPCGLNVVPIPGYGTIPDREIGSATADQATNRVPYTIFVITAIVVAVYFWRKK